MTFLPIVAREMRVSSRKASTYWVRFAAAAVALAIGGYTFFVLQFAGIATFAGQMLFGGLVGIIWIYALLGGVFKTADALSGEKREGTLGLLFLTDLKGYDIVLGKIAAASVNWLFGLLALFPILALSLLMGGVAPGEFWRKILGLTNLLFYSLALGMFVSSFTRHERRSATLTLVLLLGLLFAPNFLLELHQDWTGHRGSEPAWLVLWDVKRPMHAAGDLFYRRDPSIYWNSLAISHGIGWMFLGLASAIIPRTWQQQATRLSRLQEKATQVTYGTNRPRRDAFRRRALGINPFYWVANRARGTSIAVFLAVLAIAGAYLVDFWIDPADWRSAWSFIWPAFWLHSLIKVWFTFEACRRFVEDRRSGALEMILSTPMTPEKIVAGQWRALFHQFGGPVIVILIVDAVLVAGGLLVPSAAIEFEERALFCLILFAGVTVFLADLVALGWLSMWRGMNARHSYTAFLWCAVQILLGPWLLFYVGMTILFLVTIVPRFAGQTGGTTMVNWMEWLPFIFTVLWFLLSMAIAGLTAWSARRSLSRYFRYQATSWYQPGKAFWSRRAKTGTLPPRIA